MTNRIDIDWTALTHAQYTNVPACEARLDKYEGLRRAAEARSMLATARNPMGRFGLTVETIPAAIIELLEREGRVGFIEEQQALLRFGKRFVALEAEGMAMDEIWNILEDEGCKELGLGYGDGAYMRRWGAL